MNRIQLGTKLVKQGGKTASKAFLRKMKVSYKKAHNVSEVVTQTDRAIEYKIWHTLKRAFPEDKIIGEEYGVHEGNSGYIWYIDPIDGTQNFARKIGYYCTMLALEYKNETIAGWIYNPTADELYFAKKGKGAFLNGTRIQLSKKPIPLKDAFIAFCEGRCRPVDVKAIRLFFTRMRTKTMDIRKLASAGLEFAYVAVGRIEAFICTGTKIVDVKAGMLLVKEAGGCVTGWNGKKVSGKELEHAGFRLIACREKKLHEQLVQKLKKLK